MKNYMYERGGGGAWLVLSSLKTVSKRGCEGSERACTTWVYLLSRVVIGF